MSLMSGDLRIVPVTTPAELDRFIAVAPRLQAKDPNFIEPLKFERRAALTPKTNPFFAHAEVQMWLAVRNGHDVGRISAQIDALAPQEGGERVGHFGMICAEDDQILVQALLATAETWLAERGCTRVLGPLNLSINEEVGLLVDGFDTPPMVMMGHDPAWLGPLIEACGYTKARDVYAYLGHMSDDLPEPLRSRVLRGPPAGVTLRRLDMRRYDAEVRSLTEILNDAWSDNWGFTPTTEAETAQLASTLKMVIDPRLTWFADIDGETAGFIVFLPNINEAIADLKGRLFPLGWAKLLWRLKVARVKSIRVPLMGVKKKFQTSRRGQLLPFHLINAAANEAKALGYERYELSWILEDNGPMRRILEAIGARIYKTYRVYGRAL